MVGRDLRQRRLARGVAGRRRIARSGGGARRCWVPRRLGPRRWCGGLLLWTARTFWEWETGTIVALTSIESGAHGCEPVSALPGLLVDETTGKVLAYCDNRKVPGRVD
jgi:hypothetical protein